uniref:D-aspartate oxidase n=1 Tax=Mus musculus TaxID=10090 RepID=Q3TNE8_MOUSE|nr:unnamed protein product [Mus musculus]
MDTVCIAVVGAGVIGLSTAACISQLVPGCTVTVISDRFTPDTTSNVAAGMLIPHTCAVGRYSAASPLKKCLSGLMWCWDFER